MSTRFRVRGTILRGTIVRATFYLLYILAFAGLSQAVTPIPRPRGPVRCVGGLAGPYPCQAVDQASHVPLNDLTSVTSGFRDTVAGVLGWADEASGREFALVQFAQKVSIVEVTDAESPRLLGDYDFPNGVSDLATYQDHLYVLTRGSLQIFDISRLLGASGPPTHFPADAERAVSSSGGLTINPDTGFAYLFSPVVALDLKDDPEAPKQVFVWDPGPSYPSHLECVVYHGADTRFTGHDICFGAAPRRSLVIYDVTDKAHPAKLSRTFYRGFSHPWQTAVTPDHRFLLLSDTVDEHSYSRNTRIFLWDLSSLTAPVHFMNYDGPTGARDRHIEVRGRYAFIANGQAGLRVLDLRQIAKGRVRQAGFFDVEPESDNDNWFGAVELDVLPSGTVILGSARQGLYVLTPHL
jgi:choice-of-anchor B domain-containing protein